MKLWWVMMCGGGLVNIKKIIKKRLDKWKTNILKKKKNKV
jgi:hypothetical protein|tara:strand:+ start:433 stop:552 length:120 start_codon:yes stop_codon:yes gene_type:complete